MCMDPVQTKKITWLETIWFVLSCILWPIYTTGIMHWEKNGKHTFWFSRIWALERCKHKLSHLKSKLQLKSNMFNVVIGVYSHIVAWSDLFPYPVAVRVLSVFTASCTPPCDNGGKCAIGGSPGVCACTQRYTGNECQTGRSTGSSITTTIRSKEQGHSKITIFRVPSLRLAAE